MVRFLLIVIGVLVVGGLLWRLMIEAISFFTLLSWFLSTVFVFLLMGYVLYWAFFKKKAPAKAKTDNKNMLVHQAGGKIIYVFREEPSLTDVVKIEDELHKAQLELNGDVFQVDNDSHVIVLEDTGKETVKVRFKNADKKSRESEGWVARDVLIRPDKTLPGS